MNVLESERLVLQTLDKKDISTLHDFIFTNKSITQHTFGASSFSLTQTQSFLEELGNFDGLIGLSKIILKETNSLIGIAGVLACNALETNEYEIGFILHPEFWGKGYATEIGKAQLILLKEQLLQTRALATVSANNKASIHTLTKLGFQYTKDITAKHKGKRLVYTLSLT